MNEPVGARVRITVPTVNGSLEFDGGGAWVWRCGWDGVDLLFAVEFTTVPTSTTALTALDEELEGRFPLHVSV